MKERATIFVIDDDITNLVFAKKALAENYDVFTAPSAAKMLALFENKIPDIILLDVDMPDIDGYAAIKILKNNPKTQHIPIIFLTAKNDPASELEGLSLGAVDYISKPFSLPLLRKRIEVHLQLKEFTDHLQDMVEAKTKSVLKLQNKILGTVAELVESRDDVTGTHIQGTTRCLGYLLAALRESEEYKEEIALWDTDLIVQSAQLHDVGKISIKDSILQKPGKLTPEEFEKMKGHVEAGVRIIDQIAGDDEESDFLNYAKLLVGYHHEKWNGKGYPYGLAGENIPLLGRLMAIADVYDALTSKRQYKEAFSHEKAVKIMSEEAGSHFDPNLIKVFLRIADKLPEQRDENLRNG
ncbi:MAG: response regulator [Desulfobulbaceae bacterium]|jgi:putative two-component system response regulator|nr:response regulator [Desulfobulbaceae bacterium]